MVILHLAVVVIQSELHRILHFFIDMKPMTLRYHMSYDIMILHSQKKVQNCSF